MDSIFHKKIVYAFNSFYLNFITDLKNSNDEMKKLIKKHFKVFDKSSDTYFLLFADSLDDDDKKIMILPDTTLETLYTKINENDTNTVKSYVYIFRIIHHISQEQTDDGEKLLSKVIEIIKGYQSNTDVDELESEILDDDISKLLTDLKSILQLSKIPDTTPKVDDTMNMFENSKIGSLAKEISEEIDMTSLNINGPEDLLNFENLTGSNNVLGNIVSKVGSKIQNKIASGEINQGELVSEALGLIGMLNGAGGNKSSGGLGGLGDIASMMNNPAFKDMMSSFTGGGGGNSGSKTRVSVDNSKVRNLETRDRLRKKLEKRQQEQNKNV